MRGGAVFVIVWGLVFVIVWGIVFVIVWGVVFVIVWGLCLLLFGVVFVIVWGMCLLLSFLFGCSNLITWFWMSLVLFEVGSSSGVDCANLRSVH